MQGGISSRWQQLPPPLFLSPYACREAAAAAANLEELEKGRIRFTGSKFLAIIIIIIIIIYI